MKTTEIKNRIDTILTDDELENAAGGAYYARSECKSADEVTFIANVGDIVEVCVFYTFTVRCRVVDRRIFRVDESDYAEFGGRTFSQSRYRDEYKVEALESHWFFEGGWNPRYLIEM